MYFQRRTFRRPDLGILFRRSLRPDVKYDAVQNQPPYPSRKFHHSRIAEELLEIWTQRLGGWGIGSAEIDQQYPCSTRYVSLVSWPWGSQDSVSKIADRIAKKRENSCRGPGLCWFIAGKARNA